ncbi:MAG: hypothetical protein A3J83_06470 [Elusimicrobia bacterium RIFOXYA2_FULL_40_6]|nr:MAG: hypothetical protein A3J83_06470 [Elusimicrobia bacterium RIFOXYA2_FULL_40_6]
MNKKNTILLLLVMTIAFLLRFWGIWFDLPYLYTTEEYKVVNYALKMGSGDLNPHFFNYPSLYLYFTLVVSGFYFVVCKIFGVFHNAKDFALSFIKDPTQIYLLLRFISVLWSMAALYMVFLIARLIYSFRTAIFAVLMLSFVPSIIQSSHLIQPAIPSMFFILLSFYFLILFLNTGSNKYYYFSGAALGFGISVFYNALPMIALLPFAYCLYSKKIKLFDLPMWFGVVFVFLFFFLGTPYALLDHSSFMKGFSSHSVGLHTNLLEGLIPVILHYLYIGNKGHVTANIGIPLIGLISTIGLFTILKEKKKEGLLILAAFVLFTIPVVFYHNSGPGYLFPALGFFLIAGAQFTDRLARNKFKMIVSILFVLILLPSAIFCLKLDYSYTQKDTRTIAKVWIEENIPSGSRVLIDMYPHSPPIKETKEQLIKLYNQALAIQSYKTEYFKLQIDAYPDVKTLRDTKRGYEIYRILRPAQEVSGTIEMVKEAQKTQELIDVSGNFKQIKSNGIGYFIFNSWDELSGLNSKDNSLVKFYTDFPKTAKLLKEFSPVNNLYPGPTIRIYRLN